MQAYHNKPEIKELYLTRVQQHALADEIIKGLYWEDGLGCAVGCTVHSSSHAAYETELGIPRILARLEDRIFEGLPLKLAKTWPERFLSSIKVGADLSIVWPKFAIWLLTDAEYGVLRFAKNDRTKSAVERVAWLYANKGTKQQFRDAADAADAAAVDAADAAAADAAADAADAAAYATAAADATAAAAYATADAAAYATADAAHTAVDAAADAYATAAADAAAGREKAFIAQSEKLLELLAEV